MTDSTFDVAAKLEAYRGELGAQVNAIAEKSPFEDYRQPYLDEAAVSGDDAFPSSLLPRLASLVQGRAEPLALVATEAQAELGEGAPSVEVVVAKIRLVAERKAYGVNPKKAVVVADDGARALLAPRLRPLRARAPLHHRLVVRERVVKVELELVGTAWTA